MFLIEDVVSVNYVPLRVEWANESRKNSMLLLVDVVVVVGQNCLSLFYSEGNVYF